MADLHLTKPHMKGPAVRKLQKRLAALGFDPGVIDGEFGPDTDKAVRAFQTSGGLEVDGIAGARTRESLGLAAAAGGRKTTGSGDSRSLAQHHAAPAGSLTPAQIAAALGCNLHTVKTNWPPILEALVSHGIDDLHCQIAVLATVGTEVASFEPINEFGGPSYFTKMYEGRKDLGNVRQGDGARYHGRGYIQVTGRANYRTYGQKLGVPLEDQPDLALEPDVAAKVLAAYFADHGISKLAAAGDWQGVRRAVNGGLNGWDRFSTLVQNLENAQKAAV